MATPRKTNARAQSSGAFDGKTAVISGGTTGIGRATAIALASQGAAVLIFGRHKRELDDAMSDLKNAGGRVVGLVADQAFAPDVRKVFARAKKEFGKIDFLINNAAIAPDPLEKITDVEIDYTVRANLTGYLTCTHHAFDLLHRDGHVVNIGSMSAEKRGAEGEVYTATKAGIRGFSESLRKTFISKGIRVTLIEPGWTGSDMVDVPSPKQRKAQRNREMLKAEDIAACVLFALAQPARCDISLMQVQPLKSE